MINPLLTEDYIKRAKIRLALLDSFLKAEDYADVIRESQEVIELLQKAILLKMGILPPKWHDVIDIIIENADKLPADLSEGIRDIRSQCKWLRSQREVSFYGEMDFIPSKDYTVQDAQRAINIAKRFSDLVDSFN